MSNAKYVYERKHTKTHLVKFQLIVYFLSTLLFKEEFSRTTTMLHFVQTYTWVSTKLPGWSRSTREIGNYNF